jgi:hypothetical protein
MGEVGLAQPAVVQANSTAALRQKLPLAALQLPLHPRKETQIRSLKRPCRAARHRCGDNDMAAPLTLLYFLSEDHGKFTKFSRVSKQIFPYILRYDVRNAGSL